MNKFSFVPKKKQLFSLFLSFTLLFLPFKSIYAEGKRLNDVFLDLRKVPSDIQKEILFFLMPEVKSFLMDYLLISKREIGCKVVPATKNVCSFAFAADNSSLLLGLNDGSIEVFDVEKGMKFLTRIKCFDSNVPVSSIYFSPASKKFAVASVSSNVIKIFDFSTLTVLKTLESEKHVFSLVFNNKGDLFAFRTFDNLIKIYDFSSDKIKTFKLGMDSFSPYPFNFSPDSKKLFLGFGRGKVLALDLVNCLKSKEILYKGNINYIFFSPDCKKQAVYFTNREVRLGNINEDFSFKIKHNDYVYRVIFGEDNNRFAVLACFENLPRSSISIWHKEKLLKNIVTNSLIYRRFIASSLDFSKICFVDKYGIAKVLYLYNSFEKKALSYFDSMHKLKANQMFLFYLLFKNSIGLKGKCMNLALTQQELEKKYGYNEFLDLKKSYSSLPLELKKVVKGAFNLKDE